MITKKLLKLLEESGKKYEIVAHKMVYTAYDLSATMHIKLSQVAKSLLVKMNKPIEHGQKPYAIVVVPADKNIDLKKLARTISGIIKEVRITKIEIPKEGVMKTHFKVKPGSMSAFGSLYKLPLFIDKSLKGGCVFSSGSFTESIKMLATDFIKLEQALTGDFAVAKKFKKIKPKNQIKHLKAKQKVKGKANRKK